MPQFYKIVKKNSPEHKSVLASSKFKNSSVLPAGGRYVLVPSSRPIDVGHNVSHAKNRTIRRRLPNLRTMNVVKDEVRVNVQLTASDLRTFKRVAGAAVAEVVAVVKAKVAKKSKVASPAPKAVKTSKAAKAKSSAKTKAE